MYIYIYIFRRRKTLLAETAYRNLADSVAVMDFIQGNVKTKNLVVNVQVQITSRCIYTHISPVGANAQLSV